MTRTISMVYQKHNGYFRFSATSMLMTDILSKGKKMQDEVITFETEIREIVEKI